MAPDATHVRAALQRYLDGRRSALRVDVCERVSGGFETFIFGFSVGATNGAEASLLPAGERLILRIYRGPGVVERSAWEAEVIERVRAAGVLAPRVYLYEPDPTILGAPFLVLQVVPGLRLDQAAGANPLAVVRLLRNFARAQAGIYALDWPEGRAGRRWQSGPTLSRIARVDELHAAWRADAEMRGLTMLLPVVDWLHARLRLFEDEPDVLVHGDFHPLNVFATGARISSIIDWGAGGFTDRHIDIGWSSVLFATATSADPADDKALAPFRTLGHRLYLTAAWEAARLNRALLRCGEVYAALRWMLTFLPTYLSTAGPAVLNADAGAITTPLWVKRVRRFIEKRTDLMLDVE